MRKLKDILYEFIKTANSDGLDVIVTGDCSVRETWRQVGWRTSLNTSHTSIFKMRERPETGAFGVKAKHAEINRLRHVLSGISDQFRYRRLYLPRYSDFKISAISSGDSLQPSVNHIFMMVFKPLRKNSMWYFMFRSICSFSARSGSYREILCFSS